MKRDLILFGASLCFMVEGVFAASGSPTTMKTHTTTRTPTQVWLNINNTSTPFRHDGQSDRQTR